MFSMLAKASTIRETLGVKSLSSALLNILIKELSNVQNSQGRWTDQGPESLACPAPHGH